MSENPTSRPHVVLVDDEPDLCELLALRLDHHGYRVSVEHTSRGALEVLEREMVDAMIVDLRLEDESGLDLLTEIQKHSPDLPVIMLTAHGTIETAMEAVQRGAYGFLTKPFHDHDLLQKLEHGVERVRLRREVQGLRSILGENEQGTRLLGTSARIAAVRDVIARVAPSDATVLVLGESGTGKELARARSTRSRRARRGPSSRSTAGRCRPICWRASCSATCAARSRARRATRTATSRRPTGARSSSTRSARRQPGDAVEAAARAAGAALHARGRHAGAGVDVRVVAATNHDLRQSVAAGRFREDLFYRLHVVPIVMPPLRERKEDIPLLAELFLARAAARHGLRAAHLTSEMLQVLREHDWPGNIRELANVIEGAALLSTDGNLRPHHLLAVIPRGVYPARAPEPPPAAPAAGRARAVVGPGGGRGPLRAVRAAAAAARGARGVRSRLPGGGAPPVGRQRDRGRAHGRAQPDRLPGTIARRIWNEGPARRSE